MSLGYGVRGGITALAKEFRGSICGGQSPHCWSIISLFSLTVRHGKGGALSVRFSAALFLLVWNGVGWVRRFFVSNLCSRFDDDVGLVGWVAGFVLSLVQLGLDGILSPFPGEPEPDE
ncbi:hypothetical protein QBC34DRAFT_415210 [Podospora aff. communis PSN243]|uniref:Uncharacterized protein n=1 Tax=Podospora aff. communis PSN243 TaxID=3040156 RepID=A0AAV9GBC5_9PEZI|nr:hypothetical protein QBC34DRAFT_415210 [Podospora aff. communis PSN243]